MPPDHTGHDVEMLRPILLMTRPQESAARFLASLSAQVRAGVDVVYAPLLEIAPTQAKVDLKGVAAVIFTSINGVAYGGAGQGRAAYCVGALTTDAANAAGWRAEFAGETGDALVASLSKTRPKGPLLHLSGTHQRGDIAQRLSAAALPTTCTVVYDQHLRDLTPQALAALRGEADVFVPLFSPRTAAQFVAQIKGSAPFGKGELTVLAMSDAVAAPLRVAGLKNVLVSRAPTGHDMREELEKRLMQRRLP